MNPIKTDELATAPFNLRREVVLTLELVIPLRHRTLDRVFPLAREKEPFDIRGGQKKYTLDRSCCFNQRWASPFGRVFDSSCL